MRTLMWVGWLLAGGLAAAAMALATGTASGPPPRPPLKTERFDRDPGWDGARNRIAVEPRVKQHDFGYQRTHHAGAAAGEIGGTVWRTIAPAYYGKKLKPLTLDDPLEASGSLSLVQATATSGYQNGSTIFVGFFNHREQGWRPVNFVGFRLEGYNEPDGATIEISYGTQKWTAGGAFVDTSGQVQERLVRELVQGQLRRVAPDGARHTWRIRYDPRGGSGSGRLTFTFDGTASVLDIRPEHRKQGATFDRFGIFSAQLSGNAMTAYFDDVTINGQSHDFASDPGWEGKGNRARIADRLSYGKNDFGYSPTRHAGGSPGEIGGRFWRVEASEPHQKGYYGDEIGRLTMEDRLTARGKIAIPRFSVDSGMHIGWFNSRAQGWPPRDFIGVYLDSLSVAGRFFTPMYGTSRAARVPAPGGRSSISSATWGDPYPLFYPDGRTYDWSIDYDPQANRGGGAITITLGRERATLNLKPGHRAEGATFDRFGVFNMQDNNGKDCLVFLDDLSYTTGRRS